jgi:HPt (histidine-containing phosphotransfer) domain-containing protein
MEQQFATAEPVIDLAHLRRMTLGDRALEREVLSLFHAHSAQLMQTIHCSDAAALPALAHTLKGSALGIGANAVARAADDLQRAATPDEAAVVRLERAVEQAQAAIAGMLAPSGD